MREVRLNTEFGQWEQILQDSDVADDTQVNNLTREPIHAALQLQIGGLGQYFLQISRGT